MRVRQPLESVDFVGQGSDANIHHYSVHLLTVVVESGISMVYTLKYFKNYVLRE